ncbi:MAG TPA: hypothetical protein VGC41_13205, partial [Kofleriaceae bacterium]
MKLLVRVGAFLVFGACTQANPAATCSDLTCSDPNYPYCDIDGSVGGIPGTCVSVSCTPGDIKECRDAGAFTCNSAGNGYELQSCDLGCSSTGAPHCKTLELKYLADTCDAPASEQDIAYANTGSIDPNLDA